MEKLLFINACVREESRTYELAKHWLTYWHGDIERIDLDSEALIPLSRDTLAARTAFCEAGVYNDPMFAHAKRFKSADVILIAAPYWDLSFPACLKTYLELINICGVTFEYTDMEVPRSLCRARKLIYITTAGGEIASFEPGFGYVKALAQTFWGIGDIACHSAENLDIIGADTGAILGKAMRDISEYFEE